MYSVIAVIMFCVSALMYVRNRRLRTPFRCVYNGRFFAFMSTEVENAKLEDVKWVPEGEYIMTCTVPGSQSLISLPANRSTAKLYTREKDSIVGKKITLIAIQLPTATAYVANDVRVPKMEDGASVQVTEDSELYSKRSSIAVTIGIALWLISFLFIGNAPILASILDAFCIALWCLYRPFWDWKNNRKCCIIKKEVASKAAQAKEKPVTKSQTPLGYDHWSPVQKELHAILTRTESNQFAEDMPSAADIFPENVFEETSLGNQSFDLPETNGIDELVTEVNDSVPDKKREAFSEPLMNPAENDTTFCGAILSQDLDKKDLSSSFPQEESAVEQGNEVLETQQDVPAAESSQAVQQRSMYKGKKAKKRRRPPANSHETDIAKVLEVADKTTTQ